MGKATEDFDNEWNGDELLAKVTVELQLVLDNDTVISCINITSVQHSSYFRQFD